MTLHPTMTIATMKRLLIVIVSSVTLVASAVTPVMLQYDQATGSILHTNLTFTNAAVVGSFTVNGVTLSLVSGGNAGVNLGGALTTTTTTPNTNVIVSFGSASGFMNSRWVFDGATANGCFTNGTTTVITNGAGTFAGHFIFCNVAAASSPFTMSTSLQTNVWSVPTGTSTHNGDGMVTLFEGTIYSANVWPAASAAAASYATNTYATNAGTAYGIDQAATNQVNALALNKAQSVVSTNIPLNAVFATNSGTAYGIDRGATNQVNSIALAQARAVVSTNTLPPTVRTTTLNANWRFNLYTFGVGNGATNGMWMYSGPSNPTNNFSLTSATPIFSGTNSAFQTVRDTYVVKSVDSQGNVTYILTATIQKVESSTNFLPGPLVAISPDGINWTQQGFINVYTNNPLGTNLAYVWSPKINIVNGQMKATVGLGSGIPNDGGPTNAFIYDVDPANLFAWSNPRWIDLKKADGDSEPSAGILFWTNNLYYYFSSGGDELTNSALTQEGWGSPNGNNQFLGDDTMWAEAGPSLQWYNGLYYWFETDGGLLQYLTSPDLIHWTPNPFDPVSPQPPNAVYEPDGVTLIPSQEGSLVFEQFASPPPNGNFTGSFTGNGAGLTNLSASTNILNPIQFGAIGNTVFSHSSGYVSGANDSAGLAAVFGYASTNGGVIDLQGKTYLLNTTLLITNQNGVVIKNGTIVVTNQNLNPAIWLSGDFPRMENVNIYGPGISAYTGNSVGLYIGQYPSGGYIQNPIIENCRIQNFSTNVWCNHPVSGLFLNDLIIAPQWAAIAGYFDQTLIQGCTVGESDAGHYGIDYGPGNAPWVCTNAIAVEGLGGISLSIRHCNMNTVHTVVYAANMYQVDVFDNNTENVYATPGQAAYVFTNLTIASVDHCGINPAFSVGLGSNNVNGIMFDTVTYPEGNQSSFNGCLTNIFCRNCLPISLIGASSHSYNGIVPGANVFFPGGVDSSAFLSTNNNGAFGFGTGNDGQIPSISANFGYFQSYANGYTFYNFGGSAAMSCDNAGHFSAPGSVTTQKLATSGFSQAVFSAGGVTNTTGADLRIFGFTGTSVTFSNAASKMNAPLGTISSGTSFILQPGEMLYGSSCTEVTNVSF